MTIEFPDPSDLRMLNLELEPGGRTSRFELTPPLARQDGALYGGTGIAVSVTAMEAATGRAALWVTTQYVSTTTIGSVIELTAEVLASGKAISQVQVTGRHRGEVLFVSLGSTATPRPGGLEGQYETMPEVGRLEDSIGTLPYGPRNAEDPGDFRTYVEYRSAEVLDASPGAPHMAIWARLARPWRCTRAGLAYLADMVPPAIGRAAGIAGGGPSLDNSLRLGRLPDDLEWVLLDLRGHMAHGAHAHGSVKVWSPEGELVAVGGQSANMMFRFSPDQMAGPGLPPTPLRP